MNQHTISAGEKMYYWGGGSQSFSVSKGNMFGLSQIFDNSSINVQGGYRNMSTSTDTIKVTCTGVTSYSFSSEAPSTSNYRVFTTNNSSYTAYVYSGFIFYY
jgi:hypothetical protein